MDSHKTTLLIIGRGPGGYVAAIRAAQLGIATTLVEGANLGGTCLNIGCIPSKALIHAADAFHQAQRFTGDSSLGIHVEGARIDVAQTVRWKDGIVARLTGGVGALLKKHKVRVVQGWAQIVDGMPFGGKVISSTQALAPSAVPGKLVVVGAGYIGLELGTVYRKLGADVTVVEAQDRILPLYDEELTKPVAASLRQLGVQVLLGCKVQGLDEATQGVRILDSGATESVLEGAQVLV